MDQQYLGIDIGGTFVKFGLVDKNGKLTEGSKISTADLKEGGNFVESFIKALKSEFAKFPNISEVGIGIPGTLDKARKKPLEVPAIPELNNTNFHDTIQQYFPDKTFSLENDANAAALGEYYFSGQNLPEDFIFITLGTGVGGAVVLDGEIFKGGDGNGMEIGHIMSHGGKSLERNIGKKGMITLAETMLREYTGKTVLGDGVPVSSTQLMSAAKEGDAFALQVFDSVGVMLGQGLVAAIRILDIKTILIGGGLSATYDYIYPEMMRTMNKYLTPYYTKDINIKRATLGNDAGLVGAASLCFKKDKVY